jgi:LPXTG-motif cell wall-anchored protein
MGRTLSSLSIRFTASVALCLGLLFGAFGLTAYAYGPTTPSLTLTVSIGSGNVDTVSVNLSGFQPGEIVNVQVFSTPQELGTITANSAGAVSQTFTLPAGLPAGLHTVVATGETSGLTASAQFTLASPTAAPSSTSSTTAEAAAAAAPSSSLPTTGIDAALGVALGAGAIAVGGLLVMAARRRRISSWSR